MLSKEQIEAHRLYLRRAMQRLGRESEPFNEALCDMALKALQPEGEATSLLREIDESGVLYAHNLDLDAKVANFLNSRRPQKEQG